jgi:hypothetical protein
MWCPYQSSAPHSESQPTHPTQLLSGSALRDKFPLATEGFVLRLFEDQRWLEIIRKLTPEQRQEIIRMAEAAP